MTPLGITNGTPFRHRNMTPAAASQAKQPEVPLQAEEAAERRKTGLWMRIKKMFNVKAA